MVTMTEQECFELLRASIVGRVGFHHPHGLQILPVNYRVDGNTIVFRTSADGPLGVLADGGGEVVFEVDHHNTTGGSGWSVMMNGRVEPTTPDELNGLTPQSRLIPWAGGDRSLLLRFVPDSVDGRRVRRSDSGR